MKNKSFQERTDFIGRLSAHLFWDTDVSQIDPLLHRAFLVERIMSHGLLSDWLLLDVLLAKKKSPERWIFRN